MKHLPILAPLITVLSVVGIACGGKTSTADEPARSADIAFRDDGDLTFLGTAGDTLSIDIEIAETDSARQRGLMQRESLPEQSGMLFRFGREEIQSFWMANTPLALDILFVGADSQIVDIEKYSRPFSSSSIVSDAPAQYVIEVPAGFSDMHGITAGERVSWTRHD